MIFWRKKKNAAEQEKEHHEERLLHHKDDPALEPPTEYEAEISLEQKHNYDGDVPVHMDEMDTIPEPVHTLDVEKEARREDAGRAEEGGWFSRLSAGLSKSSRKLGEGVNDLFTKRKLDQETLESLEDLLIMADIGPQTAARIVQDFAKNRFDKEIAPQEVREALASQIADILTPVAAELPLEKPSEGQPRVILVCGVNGVGKTTTIGKLAFWMLHQKKHSVMLGAGDTFRAAAVEQLQVWGERAHAPVLAKDIGADSAAVAYEAYAQAREQGRDVLMIDTAGRLHNKKNLMAELEKIIRVLKKQDETAPHDVVLVLDATTGQNAHAQLEAFKELVNVTGLVVTKLDGSARGGVLVSLADQYKLPVYAVGIGEKMEDLQPFRPQAFARALLGLEGEEQ